MSRDEIIARLSQANYHVMEIVGEVVKNNELLESLDESDLLWIGNVARTISGNSETIMNVTYKKADELECN